MSGDPGRRRKAAERRKKRKRREDEKRIAVREELRTLAGRMVRAGRWPLEDCRISWMSGNRRMAHVIVARAGPSGITAAVLLVDLGCLGLKDCAISEDLASSEYAGLVELIRSDGELEHCSPARALKLVEAGMTYAAALGFPAHSERAAALALFGDASAEECTETFECGAGGLPFYDPSPDDDVPGVLRRLEERLGHLGTLDDECLRPLEVVFLEMYCQILHEMQPPVAPRVDDTDGEVPRFPAPVEASRSLAPEQWKTWLDQPVPVLGDVSPRTAAGTAHGRELLDVLLADYALHARVPGSVLAPDVAALRSELGI